MMKNKKFYWVSYASTIYLCVVAACGNREAQPLQFLHCLTEVTKTTAAPTTTAPTFCKAGNWDFFQRDKKYP